MILISVSSVGRLPEAGKRAVCAAVGVESESRREHIGLGRDIEIVRAHGGSIDMPRDET
jgi:hypothetical protein